MEGKGKRVRKGEKGEKIANPMRKKAELREVKRLHSKDKVSCMRWVEK
jgi:hypothetical protein